MLQHDDMSGGECFGRSGSFDRGLPMLVGLAIWHWPWLWTHRFFKFLTAARACADSQARLFSCRKVKTDADEIAEVTRGSFPGLLVGVGALDQDEGFDNLFSSNILVIAS
jgi:hypothetical protein